MIITQHSPRLDPANLASLANYTLPPTSITEIQTGLRCALPDGSHLQLSSRASLALRGVLVVSGVAERRNQGSLRVLLHNINKEKVKIQRGEKIGRGVFTSHDAPEFHHVESLDADQCSDHRVHCTA